MRLGKMSKTSLIFVFIGLFLLTRLPMLGYEAINPDAVNWHLRSEQFVNGLKYMQLEKTYQHYHPGVTLMWIIGPTVEILRQFFPIHRVYNHDNFIVFHIFSKFSLISIQLILSVLAIWFLTNATRLRTGLIVVSLFTFETFFIGNSRLLHLDILLSLFIFLALVSFFAGIKQNSSWFIAFAGAFTALAFLTKSIAVGLFLYLLVFGAYFLYKRSGLKVAISLGAIFLFSTIAVLFLAFPALWKDFGAVMLDILNEAERVGVRKGHGQLFFGEYTRDPGLFFYPLVIAIKTTPFLLFGVIAYLIHVARNFLNKEKLISQAKSLVSGDKGLVLFMTIFYVGYFLVMLFPSKKLDRYMLPLFPYFAMLTYVGYKHFLKDFGKVAQILVLVLFLGTYVLPIITKHPFHFTYTSPLFVNAQNADKIIAQKPFGVGIYQLKTKIIYDFGHYLPVGFYDVKPMSMIYKNSRVHDVRVSGTSSYDVLVLASDEEMPDEIINSEWDFEYHDSVWINGLEYWRIYAKTNAEK